MGSFALRVAAILAAAATFVGANAYVIAHPKNPAAPLQPPTATEAAARPSATARAAPRITLQPGVRATELPGITYTHVS
jgi:hypothetical protein